jgi:NAD(P)-dependent dehydrogenase (short-subunit alcohol dehydrogenase family)
LRILAALRHPRANNEDKMPAAAKGRVAVVTGGASGLGLATVGRLVADGLTVAIWDNDRDSLEIAAKSVGIAGRVATFLVDVGDPVAVANAARETGERLAPPSVLVTAAGISGLFKPYTEYELDLWNNVIRVNLTGTHLVCQALLPAMIANGFGRIVTVSSIAGKEGNALQVGYASAKAGVIGFTKALGREMARTGVIVNCIAPALFDTPLVKKTLHESAAGMTPMFDKIPMGRIGRPEEFAAMAAWLSSEECSFTTGMIFDASGGRATY